VPPAIGKWRHVAWVHHMSVHRAMARSALTSTGAAVPVSIQAAPEGSVEIPRHSPKRALFFIKARRLRLTASGDRFNSEEFSSFLG